MANGPTNTVFPQKKPTVNFPVQQPGQPLPLVPTAVQEPTGFAAPTQQQPSGSISQQPIQTLGAPGGPQPAATPPPSPVAAPQQDTGALEGAGQVFDPNLSQKVVQGAQQQALGGVQTGTTGLVTQKTQELLQDPSLGRDPQAERKLATDQLRREQAQDFEALRQATGGVANTGINLQNLVSAQLQQRQERTDVGRQFDIDEQDRRQNELVNALVQGRETAGLEQAQQTAGIQDLISAAGGALGFAELASKKDVLLSQQEFETTQAALDKDFQLAVQNNDLQGQKDILSQQLAFENKQAQLGREFTASQNDLNRILETNLANLDINAQKEMVNLKAMVDKDILMQEQDFAASENELNRQLQEALQQGDQAQANAMAIMLNEFETVKLQKQQEWQSAENLAQNAFSQQMQMDQNEFSKATQYLQHELDLATSDNDLQKQQILMDKQAQLELQQMTQNFGFQEKLAVLDSELQQAFANQDVERQKELHSFTHGLNMQQIEQEQGFEESMAYLNNTLQQALNDGDFEQAKILNGMQYDHQMMMHLDNVSLDQAKIDLQQQGIDMAQVESEYNKIQDLIAQGQLAPENAQAYLETAFSESLPEGFKFEAADPLATQKALQEDYLNQQFQYALAQGDTNGDGVLDAAVFGEGGQFMGLTDSVQSGFDGYMQDTLFGQTGTPLQADIISYKNGDIPIDQISGINDPAYQYLLNDVSVPKMDRDASRWDLGETGSGSDSRTTIPQLENQKFVNYNGVIYEVTSKDIDDRVGDDDTFYLLTNVANGKTAKIVASEESSKMGNNTGNIAVAGIEGN